MTTPAAKSRKKTRSLPQLIADYYAALKDLAHQNVLYEMGVRPAFHHLLQTEGKKHGWTLIAEHEKKVNGKLIRPDGTFKDQMNLVRGYWEAKDTSDKLDTEIEKKRKAGYPLNNIIFEDTATAVLYQHGAELLRADMKDPAKLADLITTFFRYVEPEIEEFEHAVDEFKQRVPDLAQGLAKKIEQAHRTNPAFKRAFADFFELCKTSLNPSLSQAAELEEVMLGPANWENAKGRSSVGRRLLMRARSLSFRGSGERPTLRTIGNGADQVASDCGATSFRAVFTLKPLD